MLDEVDILSWLDQTEPVTSPTAFRSARTDTLTSEEISGTCFEITREVLLSLLERAITAVPTRDMVPVLMNFQLRVDENKLTVIGSSLEMAIVVSTDQVQTKVAGVEVFPARKLLSIVKEANPGSNIYIEVTAAGAVIVSGGFSAEIRLALGRDFPNMTDLDAVAFHEVNRASFINTVAQVKYALPGKDYSGQASMKVISVKGGKFTACDAARFQQARIDGFKLNMQLPAFSIATMLKVLGSSNQETLEIGETKNHLVFRLGTTVLYMNKLTDPYPNVEQLWLRPALANDQELKINRSELLTAIKQVKVAADPNLNTISLKLDSDRVTITAKDINDTASSVIACTWAGKPKSLTVNYFHLAEMLKAYGQDECRFLLGEDTKTYRTPILLKDDDTLAIATIAQLDGRAA